MSGVGSGSVPRGAAGSRASRKAQIVAFGVSGRLARGASLDVHAKVITKAKSSTTGRRALADRDARQGSVTDAYSALAHANRAGVSRVGDGARA